MRLVDAAIRRLSAFPNPHCDLDRDEAVRTARVHRDWASALVAKGANEKLDAAEFPKLRREGKSQVPRPPSDNW